jgi:hypothetical protein
LKNNTPKNSTSLKRRQKMNLPPEQNEYELQEMEKDLKELEEDSKNEILNKN